MSQLYSGVNIAEILSESVMPSKVDRSLPRPHGSFYRLSPQGLFAWIYLLFLSSRCYLSFPSQNGVLHFFLPTIVVTYHLDCHQPAQQA